MTLRSTVALILSFLALPVWASCGEGACKPDGELATPAAHEVVNLAQVEELITEKAILIDSRPERSFAAGTIPGAINISDSKFDKLTDRLPTDKDSTLVFFCGGLKCDLSAKSASKAKALGYRKVFVFAEGHPAWVAVHGSPASIEPGKDKGSISIASFERILKESPSRTLIVDVRDEKDVKKGTFPGAINIPVGALEKRMNELPKDKPVIFICATGARSGEAYDTVRTLGEGFNNVWFLDANVSFENGKHTISAR